MNSRLFPACLIACTFLVSPVAQAAGWAPDDINSISVRFIGTKATYRDDLGSFILVLSSSDLNQSPFQYQKSQTDANVGKLIFTEWKKGNETYSGSYTMTFTSRSAGTYYKNFKGSYAGYISGTFKILAMDVPGRPVAKSRTVKVKAGKKARFRLVGKALDIRKTELQYQITSKPKVGRLVTSKLPVVTYVPKPGFKGVVKFRYVVKEGTSKSRTATVKLIVK